MASKYNLLTQEEMDDIIVSFMKSQQRELFCYEINRDRYEEMLEDKDLGKEFGDRVSQLLNDTNSRIRECQSIMNATISQMPPQERIESSMQRLKSKEEAEESRSR